MRLLDGTKSVRVTTCRLGGRTYVLVVGHRIEITSYRYDAWESYHIPTIWETDPVYKEFFEIEVQTWLDKHKIPIKYKLEEGRYDHEMDLGLSS